MQDGLDQDQLTEWLLSDWRSQGPPVALIEGFSGIGKSTLARRVAKAWDAPKVMVHASDGAATFEDVLFDIAAGLEADGNKTVADQADGDFRQGLLELLRGSSLVVIDNFDNLLEAQTRQPRADFIEFLKSLAEVQGLGRLLLVTGQSPAFAPWMESAAIRTMAPPRLEAAQKTLKDMLVSRALESEVPPEQLSDVVAWLGRNPRAMQAFVGCLRDEPLDELIQLDPETWELKDQAAAPTLVARLEQMFLAKTIDRLDPAALLLLESLSVYRKPFSIEAINSAVPQGANPNVSRDALLSRFLLAREKKWYSVNPVARHLSTVRLQKENRRLRAAHNRAADHFMKRVRGEGQRALIRSGSEFVEARYHLIKAGRESDYQNLAGDYRRLLLRNYQYLSDSPVTEGDEGQLVNILISALTDEENGYSRLRSILAKLLVRRNRPGDDVLALRQITVATRESRDFPSWALRAELTARLDGASALSAVATQAVERLSDSVAADVCVRVAEQLSNAGHQGPALAVVRQALEVVAPQHTQRLHTIAGYILTRAGQSQDAVIQLERAYRGLDAKTPGRYRLFEEALFIAFQDGDSQAIRRVRTMVIEDGMNEHQPILADILLDQLNGQYRAAAERAEGHLEYYAIGAQAAFCWLVVGEVEKAVACLEVGRYQGNRANAWLRALVAICQDAAELYVQAMSDCIGHDLTDEELSNDLLWVEVWDHVPPRLGIYPAFYFPTLPSGLTQLDQDMKRRARGQSTLHVFPLSEIRLPRARGQRRGARQVIASGAVGHFVERAPSGELHINIYGNEGRMGDTYNVYGQAGAVGQGASSTHASFQQVAGVAATPQVLQDLQRVMDATSSENIGPNEVIARDALEAAIEAGRKGDEEGFVAHLKSAGVWAVRKAGDIGAEVAAIVIRRAMGLE